MRFNDIVSSVVKQFQSPNGNKRVPYLESKPGSGKSACAEEIMQQFGISKEKLAVIHASLYEPCDVLGLPDLSGDFCKWLPAQMFYNLRQGQGKCGLIIEELPDALVPMQNALCGVIYDRRAGQLKLSDELVIVATGNRVQDKSGANRMVSKLANRISHLEFTESVEDWTKWAMARELNPILIAFMRFRPELLSQFEPTRFSNPTPRSWERVAHIPNDLPLDIFMEHVKGEVSEGPASEFAGFMETYKSLPPLDSIFKDPKGADVPKGKPAVLYALTMALAKHVTAEKMEPMVQYLKRLPPEFSVMCIKDAVQMNPKLNQTRAFGDWAMHNAEVLM